MDEKRFKELYNRAYERGYTIFSDFLNLDEQSILKNAHLDGVCYGGYDMAQRVIVGFGDNIEKSDFPIKCVCCEPLNIAFSDKLNHRDFLGAIMNLGIKREVTGDIIVNNGKAYILCDEKIADYICENLTRVRHTSVKCAESALPETVNEKPDPISVFIPSQRLDAVISGVYKLSRSESAKLISSQKVFINSRLTLSASHILSKNDIVSVRGYGRFEFIEILKQTKKGRLVAEVIRY